MRYCDRHVPLLDGTVAADGIDLTVLEVGQTIHIGPRYVGIIMAL